MKHLTQIGTAFTLCGESRGKVQSTTHIDEVDCLTCIKQQFEGEIEYLREINYDVEDRVLSWYLKAVVVCVILVVILWVVLLAKGLE